jgi:HSP20 family molecular chaperone IbpA
MKISVYCLVLIYVTQAMGISIKSKPLKEEDDRDHSVTPFFSFWDDLPADYSFPSLSTIFGDMVQRHNQLLSNFRNNNDDLMAPLHTHPFLRGLSALSSSLHPVQFKIVDNDENFQVLLHLPIGMTYEDVRVEVQDDGTHLRVTGKTQSSNDNGTSDEDKTISFHAYSSTSFTQSFSLDPRVEVDQFSATFKDGWLTVSAPKDKRKIKNEIQVIPIQDLDGIAGDAVTPELPGNTSINRRPHFLHSWPLFDRTPAGTTEVQRADDDMVSTPISEEVRLSQSEAITDGWEDMHGSSL